MVLIFVRTEVVPAVLAQAKALGEQLRSEAVSASRALYEASPWQQRYHDSDVNELLGAGSAGPGKTQCLIFEPINQVLIEHARCMRDPSLVAQPGSTLWKLIEENPLEWGDSRGHALYMRRTSPRLMPVIDRTMRLFPIIDPDAHYEVQHMMWRFKSGYKYQFGHCVNRDDWMQYQGVELSILCIDELVEMEQEQYEQIKGRVRTDDPVLVHFKKVRSMSNPVMRRSATENMVVNNPMWVRDYFVQPAPQGNVRLERKLIAKIPNGDGTYRVEERTVTRMYMPAKIDDNPNKEFVEDYRTQLLAAPEHMRAALLDGDWYRVAGGYYSDLWDPSVHVCRPFKIPDDWSQFRMLDWGFKHPGCCLWGALDGDDNLFVHREYDFRGKDAKEAAKDIREIEKSMGLWAGSSSRLTGPADTQLWEVRGDVGKSKAQEMADVGVRWVPASKGHGSRARNGMRIIERLMATGNASEGGGLVIFETCSKLIRTLVAIQTDPADERGETPAKSDEDDPHDTLGYGIEYVSRNKHPAMRPSEKERRERDEWGDDDEVSGTHDMDLGRDGYGGKS